MVDMETRNDLLEKAKQLVTSLESGDDEAATNTLEQLADFSENDLFREVGRLTRELHEAINGFLLDAKITDLAQREIPDASERLTYVITMTEKSANTTLGAVEESLPLANELGEKATELSGKWDLFRERKMTVDDFRILSGDLTSFLSIAKSHSKSLHGNLSSVLLAQDFQDLTGQIIRQVIALVTDIEDKLVQLVRISGAKMPEKKYESDENKLEGPIVPGVEQGDVVEGQDDVDDLLSSLGF
ncbi:MAG: protein phosphatase CheZ [Gammaproteobacteria bacterium]|nr:protein phosphatase CheZ [Gammaproteobacteria bacterium]